MITGLLVVALLALREGVRFSRGASRALPLIDRVLVPAGVGLAVVLAVRVIELAARSA